MEDKLKDCLVEKTEWRKAVELLGKHRPKITLDRFWEDGHTPWECQPTVRGAVVLHDHGASMGWDWAEDVRANPEHAYDLMPIRRWLREEKETEKPADLEF